MWREADSRRKEWCGGRREEEKGEEGKREGGRGEGSKGRKEGFSGGFSGDL